MCRPVFQLPSNLKSGALVDSMKYGCFIYVEDVTIYDVVELCTVVAKSKFETFRISAKLLAVFAMLLRFVEYCEGISASKFLYGAAYH